VTACCRLRGLLFVCLVLFPPLSARGQETGAAETALTIPPSPAGLLESATLPAGVGTQDCPNYWIISTRECAQRPGPCPAGCDFEVFHAQADCWQQTDMQEFLGALQPSVPVCIVVHGSFVNWKSVRYDSHYTYRWLRAAAPQRPLHVVFLTWPSDECLAPLPRWSISLRGCRSAFNGIYLAQLVCRIPADHPVSLFGHSHGARMIVSALHLLGGGGVSGERLMCCEHTGHRLRAVLAAAAFEHDWLNPGERYDRALWRTECLVNLRNQKDFALGMYPFLHPGANRTLGRRGFSHDDRCQLGLLNPKTVEIDVTPLVGRRHVWPAYYAHPPIAGAIAPYIYFADPAELQAESQQHRMQTPSGSAPVLQRESLRLNPFDPRRFW
jgi:hypothetical protein